MRQSSVLRRSSLEYLSLSAVAKTAEEGQRLIKALSSCKINSLRKFGLYCQDYFVSMSSQQTSSLFQWLIKQTELQAFAFRHNELTSDQTNLLIEFMTAKTKSKSSKLGGADIHKSCNFDTDKSVELFLSFLEWSVSLKKFVLGRMVGKRTISATIVDIV